MDTYRFDRQVAEAIEADGTVGASQVKFGHSTGEAHLNTVYLEPGGTLGAHEAPVPQLFIVVEGHGWVTGSDGMRRNVGVGDAVVWEQGEMDESGTDEGMTVVIMQALELKVQRLEPVVTSGGGISATGRPSVCAAMVAGRVALGHQAIQ